MAILTNNDLIAAARALNVEVAAIRAVDTKESGGKGFVADGQIVMRFETHLFLRETGVTVNGYNRAAFDKAAAINRTAAIRSTSWGRYQILGSNFRSAGYSSPESFLNGQLKGEPEQLRTFVRLLLDWNLDDALRNRDWHEFARRYNGKNYKPDYPADLARYYGQYSKQAFPANDERIPQNGIGTAIFALVLLGLLGAGAYLSARHQWPLVWKTLKQPFTRWKDHRSVP